MGWKNFLDDLGSSLSAFALVFSGCTGKERETKYGTDWGLVVIYYAGMF